MPTRLDGLGWHDPSDVDLTPLCHIITPVGMLGYGFDEDLVEDELVKLVQNESIPTAIILDSGSTDSGPSKLALGTMTAPRDAYKRDLTKLIRLVDAYKVPLLFSSAGGDGSDAHVDEMRAVIDEIISESFPHQEFKVLSIYAEVPKALVKQRLEQGLISGCGLAVPALTTDDIDSAPIIVAQMGCEPFLEAMFAVPDFDIVIGGRAYDPSPYVAYAAYHAMNPQRKLPLSDLGEEFLGGAFHMGKIMECGGLCAVPKSQSAKATMYTSGAFDITPLAVNSICTPLSVAAHTLYEKSRPDLLYSPGGCLDLTFSKYEQLSDGRSVRPRGAIFRPLPSTDKRYTVKLEGACVNGYRTIFMGSFRDPGLVRQLDCLLERTRDYVGSQHKGIQATWDLQFHKYGDTDGSKTSGREVFIVGEALADTQALANSVASSARIAVTHGSYPGQKVTSGNFAFGLGGKNEFEAGPCTEFCIYHLMDLEVGEEGAREVTVSAEMLHGDDITKAPSTLFTFRRDTLGRNTDSHKTSSAAVESMDTREVRIVTKPHARPISTVPTNSASRQTHSNGYSVTNGVVENACETLGDVAKILRSKNAGPYEITLDVMFDSQEVYHSIKNSNLLNRALISTLFEIKEPEIIYCGFFDQAMAFKATIPRMKGGQNSASGGYMENDVHGSGQYLPLMNLRLPEDLVQGIQGVRSTAKA